MHTGVENRMNRTRTGRLAECPAEGASKPCASLPESRQGRPACPLAGERGLTHLLPSASEGKTLKNEEQSFDGGKKERQKTSHMKVSGKDGRLERAEEKQGKI